MRVSLYVFVLVFLKRQLLCSKCIKKHCFLVASVGGVENEKMRKKSSTHTNMNTAYIYCGSKFVFKRNFMYKRSAVERTDTPTTIHRSQWVLSYSIGHSLFFREKGIYKLL